jgi:L,D-transpeptidase catalytic domain
MPPGRHQPTLQSVCGPADTSDARTSTLHTSTLRITTRILVALIAFVPLLPAGAALAGDGIGVVDARTGEWYLRDPATGETTSFYYGDPGDTPFVGDWDCDGVATPGLYRRSDGYVYLRNSNTQGVADLRFYFGNPGDVALAGDWDGDGCDTVSLYRPSEGRFYVINELGSADQGLGAAAYSYVFGNPGDEPFAGDFDGDGLDTFGVTRNSRVFLSNSHAAGPADVEFDYATSSDILLAGDWAAGTDTIAAYRVIAGVFGLRHTNTAGVADEEIQYGNTHSIPVAGDFGQLPGGDEPPAAPPPYPDVGSGKRIIYCNSCQRIWMVDEHDHLYDTYLITGRKGIPPPGVYHVFSKSEKAYAPYGGITMDYMVRFVLPYSIVKPYDGKLNPYSYGFHSIPKYPDETLLHTILGQFGSGGCVRQEYYKAKALYDWTPIGTPVYVLP